MAGIEEASTGCLCSNLDLPCVSCKPPASMLITPCKPTFQFDFTKAQDPHLPPDGLWLWKPSSSVFAGSKIILIIFEINLYVHKEWTLSTPLRLIVFGLSRISETLLIRAPPCCTVGRFISWRVGVADGAGSSRRVSVAGSASKGRQNSPISAGKASFK